MSKFLEYIRQVAERHNAKAEDAPSRQFANPSKIALPELFTLLASSPAPNGGTSDIPPFNADALRQFSRDVFQNKVRPSQATRTNPGALPNGVAARDVIVAVGKSQGISITPEEADEIVRLLETGEFLNDISAGTAAIVQCVRGLPLAIFSDVRGGLSPGLVFAVLEDVGSILNLPKTVRKILSDLEDGSLDDPPALMKNTLQELYRRATISRGLQTIHQLYAKENRSVRLATILYARSHGVELTEQDIDVALETALNPENPNLGPALAHALTTFRSRM